MYSKGTKQDDRKLNSLNSNDYKELINPEDVNDVSHLINLNNLEK